MKTDPEKKGLKNYIPLIVIVILTLAAATAQQFAVETWNAKDWMHRWMGFFLVVFSMLKLFDLRGFAMGFQKYDLLAKRISMYGLVYPFIELALGLGLLAHWNPPIVYAATGIVMLFGAIGVIVALARGLDVNCACLGTSLQVPLSSVALLEDLTMSAMAFFLLVTA